MSEHGHEPAVAAPAADAAAASPAVFAALPALGAAGPSGLAGQLAARPAGERAAAVGALHRSAGNVAVARLLSPAPGRVLARQPVADAAAPAEATSSQTWQHEAVRPRAEAIEEEKAKAKPKDRGLELYMELVPAVVRAVKGYSTADGKQVPIENAMLIIAQGTAEHSPYNPETLDKPVIPAGNMLWGVTSDGSDPSATVKTTTDEVKGGQRVTEHNRSFRAYGSLEEAAVGYLRALEGTDPNAAKNPKYQQVLAVLTKPGATPEEFGAVLDRVKYATAPTYGKEVAANAGEGSWATAKRLIKKFMPQIKLGQQDGIDALRAKQAAYQDLIVWIDDRIGQVQAQMDEIGESSEETAPLEDEIRRLQTDRETALIMAERIEPQLAKEQQMLADLDEFAATLEPPAAP